VHRRAPGNRVGAERARRASGWSASSCPIPAAWRWGRSSCSTTSPAR
jgi:hypothetical protein